MRGRTERAHFSFGAGFGNSILSSADLPSERVEEQCGARIEGCGSGHDSRQPRTLRYGLRCLNDPYMSIDHGQLRDGVHTVRPTQDATFRILAPKLKCSRELAATRQDRHSLLQ